MTAQRPAKTLNTAIAAAHKAIRSGVLANGRAATAGTIKNAITSKNADDLHGNGDGDGQKNIKSGARQLWIMPLGGCQILVQRQPDQRLPKPKRQRQYDGAAAVDPKEIRGRDREDIAEQDSSSNRSTGL